METNFFQTLSSLQIKGEWVIVINQTQADLQIVSVLVKDDTCGDAAAKKIIPLTLSGTPSEMDDGFFSSIQTPTETKKDLLTNMEQYLKSVETAKTESQKEKDKTNKVVKEKTVLEKAKTEKEKKYDNGLKLADELEAEGKHRDAWMKVPDPGEYPEHADFLRNRRQELSAHFAPSLFS